MQLKITLQIDKEPWDVSPDPGSKQWLVAEALRSESDNNEPSKKSNSMAEISADGELPEDKFHVKLPANVDKYTGVAMDPDEVEYPEDIFHKKDAQSTFLIEQRERERREKIERHEKLDDVCCLSRFTNNI